MRVCLQYFEGCSLLQLFAKETQVDLSFCSPPDGRHRDVFADLPSVIAPVCETSVCFMAATLKSFHKLEIRLGLQLFTEGSVGLKTAKTDPIAHLQNQHNGAENVSCRLCLMRHSVS